MNSVQESKNELDAAIRYAENAISSAKQTIESMEFRQEMAQKQYSEKTGREEALTKQVQELEREVQRQQDLGQGYYDSMMEFKSQIVLLEERIADMQADMVSDAATIKKLRDEKEALREATWTPPTMPVIPKDVAIAIFREGVQSGINDAVAELEGQSINISENEYVGDFSITFDRDIDIDEYLDLDWMRDKVGQYNEEFVVGALKGLCADKEFECRIHGVDDVEAKDSASA